MSISDVFFSSAVHQQAEVRPPKFVDLLSRAYMKRSTNSSVTFDTIDFDLRSRSKVRYTSTDVRPSASMFAASISSVGSPLIFDV